MKSILALLLIFCSSAAMAQLKPMSLKEARQLLSNNLPENIAQSLEKTPNEYSFLNAQGENSVAYIGQVMRQVLIADSKLAFGSMRYGELVGKKGTAISKLNAYYLYNVETHGGNFFKVGAKDTNGTSVPFWEGFDYSSVFPRKINLKSKFAGVDNPLRKGKLLGWKSKTISGVVVDRDQDGIVMPHELYEAMIEVVANNAASNNKSFTVANGSLDPQTLNGAHLTVEGYDMAQMAQKLLHGAVSFSQAAGDYTSVDLDPAKKKGLLADNSQLFKTRPYTVLQHHWDEAFGYFGAARNYLEYTDLQIRKGYSIDAYSTEDVEDPDTGAILFSAHQYGDLDDEISISSEKNLGMSLNAAKRDLGAILGNENFTQKIMSSFLKGRQLIQEQPEGYLKYAQAHGVLAIHQWERVLAATAVHYVNSTVKDLKVYGTEKFSFAKLAKHWGEMKGFAFAFQFNPNSAMTEEQFVKMHDLMRDRPVDLVSGDIKAYIADLIKARDIMEKAYEFKFDNVEKW